MVITLEVETRHAGDPVVVIDDCVNFGPGCDTPIYRMYEWATYWLNEPIPENVDRRLVIRRYTNESTT